MQLGLQKEGSQRGQITWPCTGTNCRCGGKPEAAQADYYEVRQDPVRCNAATRLSWGEARRDRGAEPKIRGGQGGGVAPTHAAGRAVIRQEQVFHVYSIFGKYIVYV